MKEVSPENYAAVQNLYQLIQDFDIHFESDDPYCSVVMCIDPAGDNILIGTSEREISNWLEAHEEFI